MLRIPPHEASLILQRLFQLLEAAGAIHAGGGRKIGLRGDQQGRRAVAGVEMLEDDAVRLDRQLEQIAFFPIVALLVDKRVSGTLDHNEIGEESNIPDSKNEEMKSKSLVAVMGRDEWEIPGLQILRIFSSRMAR